MDDAPAVTISQRIQQLRRPRQHLRFGDCPPAFDVLRQAVPTHKIHYQVGVAAFLEEIGHPYQVGMLQPGQHQCLLLKLLPQFRQQCRIEIGLGKHLLDGDQHIQARIHSAIDRSHAPLPQGEFNTIPSL
ncbi:MAG: hypothetical protein BWY25_03198 [Chloroflexi bacterium ADurb.Bin222]|nr:MAG: hypothetical protein BWY25_03198 [Chloroflexi bacterium ADurb.Bin222]